MKTYKIKLHHEQLQFLYESLQKIFTHKFVNENIDHVTFYNVKSFIKTLHTKLYRLSDTIIDRSYAYRVSIDLNEYKALKEMYALSRESIEQNTYLRVVYLQVFAQCDKQEVDLMERHLYQNKPTALIQHKIKGDNLKSPDDEPAKPFRIIGFPNELNPF